MARFRYRMQSILNIKEKLETQAKQEFGLAQRALNAEEDKLALLIERKAGYERELREDLSGQLHVMQLKDGNERLRVMDEMISMQRLQVRLAEEAVEKAREKLSQAMKERKAQERLREKAFEAFLQEESKAEMKEIDQLTSYTYAHDLN